MALANLEDILKFNGLVKKESRSNQIGLFGGATLATSLRLKPAPMASAVEKLAWEKELLGLYI
ncbi:MAG: hypothetical protein AAB885_00045, partial [Patescibacteria group bacterium]